MTIALINLPRRINTFGNAIGDATLFPRDTENNPSRGGLFY